jgi:hypothetical protein
LSRTAVSDLACRFQLDAVLQVCDLARLHDPVRRLEDEEAHDGAAHLFERAEQLSFD